MNYDDRGQLTSESTTYGDQTYTVSYGYDIRGRRDEVTHPSGRKAEYSFTDRGILDTIKWDGSEIEDRDYNAIGQLTSIDRPSIDESRTYFDNGQVQTIASGAVGTATYAYDANGNKLSESWSGAMSAWNFTTQAGGSDGYDAEDRFMNFNQSAQSKTLSMTRSDIGNITNVSLNGTSTARGYSSTHELTSVGANSQSFDADGNLTSSTDGNTYNWDEAGMMNQATVAGGLTVDYGYSADGKRIWKKVGTTETVYIYSGPNCIAEYTKGAAPSSSGNEYVYAGGIDSIVMLVRSAGNDKLAVTRNQQWNISALINASGSVVERYTYAEFGKRTILAANGSTVRTSSSYNMPYGYTSRRHEDETGLMYFRARYYDTMTGEFISRDPLEYVDGMSMHRAYFVSNSIDPTGTVRVRCGCYRSGWSWAKKWVTTNCNGMADSCCRRVCPRYSGEWRVVGASDDPGNVTESHGGAFVSMLLGFLGNINFRAGTKQDYQICAPIPSAPTFCGCIIISIEGTLQQCCDKKTCFTFRVQVDLGAFLCTTLQGGNKAKMGPTRRPSPNLKRWKKLPGHWKGPPVIAGGATNCPPEGITGQVCGTASVGFGTWTVGARACRHFTNIRDLSEGRTTWTYGAGVGHGTGISGGGGITGTICGQFF